jgi:hypothetical protein
MSLGATRSRLAALTRELSACWLETRESWQDAKRDEFEQQYLQVLFTNVDRSIAALERLEELLKKVRKDCE